jgi:hypothetical protein
MHKLKLHDLARINNKTKLDIKTKALT